MTGQRQRREKRISVILARIQMLELTLQRIEQTRTANPTAKFPTDDFVQGLKFEVRAFRTELERLRTNRRSKGHGENVIDLFHKPKEVRD